MFRCLQNTRPHFIRLIAATTLAAFVVASIGYPVWSQTAGKDLSQPFPCMHRQCGCRDAQQCWRGCCCFSNRAKLAWAKQNGVKAPEFVAVAAKREKTKAVASCCSTKKADARVPLATPVQCGRPLASGRTPGHAVNQHGQARGTQMHIVSFIEALSCQGHVEQWVAVGAIDVVAPEVWQLDLPLSGTVSVVSESSDSLAVAPASPPPWRSVV